MKDGLKVITMDELKAMQNKAGVTIKWDDLPNATP